MNRLQRQPRRRSFWSAKVVRIFPSALELSMPKFWRTQYSCLPFYTARLLPSSCSFQEVSLHTFRGAVRSAGSCVILQVRQPCSIGWAVRNNRLPFLFHPSSSMTWRQIRIIPWTRTFHLEVQVLVSFLAKCRLTFRDFQNLQVWSKLRLGPQCLGQSSNILLPSTTCLSLPSSLQDSCKLSLTPDRYQHLVQLARQRGANHQVFVSYQGLSLSDQSSDISLQPHQICRTRHWFQPFTYSSRRSSTISG